MKLQSKFNLGIVATFVILAVCMTALSINYVNTNTIREAENRVRIYARAAWEIHDAKISRVCTALQILSQETAVVDYLADSENEHWLTIRQLLEGIRREQEMDVLNLIGPDGRVLLRTRAPYNVGDSLAEDPLVKQALATQQSSCGNIILELSRLDLEGSELTERCLAVGGEPRGMFAGAAVPVMKGGKLLGVLQMGSLLNGATEKVDTIRDAVFANEYYKDKPVGTATIFMGDLRISTNVLDQDGRRAVGTRVSREVADRVLGEGLPWTGRAYVVDTWYLAQYDPIRDPNNTVIGMLYVGELEQKYLDLRTRAVGTLVSVIFAGMLLALLVMYVLVRSIVQPVQVISEATHRFSSGDLQHRVAISRTDEVGDLATSFNRMAEQLANQRQELEHRQQELETLSAELQVTNRNYIEMLGFVTHELKNPLTSAMMGLYTVKDGYLGDLTPAQKKSLESVAKSLDYFQDMVRNYLELSRLEKGELEVRKRQVTLQTDVVEPALDSLGREIQERHMTVDNRLPADLVLNADGNLMRIVYDNLLSNALKYGREGGTISLEAVAADDLVTLSVRNDGEGIPPEKKSMLFRRFSRLDTPQYAGKKGTGLGLFICKEIVEKHGGQIWVDSKIGEWVKFSFTLPN